MTDNNETVRDIRAEMNECKATSDSTGGCSECNGFDCRDVRRFAERILAAHEREVAAKDAEIARLRAALKPILDYDFGVNTTPWRPLEVDGVVMEGCVRTADGCPLSAFDNLVFGTVSLIGMANAIGEAQRIMREGGSHD